MSDYHGHMTRLDGTHVALSEEEASAWWAAIEEARKKRRELMPTSLDALEMLCTAKERLREEGWSGTSYCPKDGSEFALIEFGSSGIHRGSYSGKWPSGTLHCADDTSSPYSCLWKALDLLSDGERDKMQRCEADLLKSLEADERRYNMLAALPEEKP